MADSYPMTPGRIRSVSVTLSCRSWRRSNDAVVVEMADGGILNFRADDVIDVNQEALDVEPVAAERVPMLDVTHMDDTMGYYPLPRGYRIDSASRTLVIKGAKGEPPTRIPLDNVRYWTTRTP